MECPRCHKTAIAFRDWARGTSAFRTICVSCGAELRGDLTIWLGLVLTVILVVLAIPFSEPLLEMAGLGGSEMYARSVVVFAVASISVGLTWLLGGYELANPRASVSYRTAPGKPWPFWIVATIAIIAFIGTPLALVITGWEDLLIGPFGITTEGQVISMTQGEPFLDRPGDYEITYEFRAAGQKWRDRDVLPPALAEQDLDGLTIRYFRWRPSISAIASQVSTMPFIGLGLLVIFVVAYLRDE